MQIKYCVVPVIDTNKGKTFLTRVLGYKHSGPLEINDVLKGELFQDDRFEFNFLMVKIDEASKYRATVLINTSDCVKRFHELKQSGVKFVKTPQYFSNGLVAEFSDRSGNRFILIEERNYEEI